ncbi:PQQ-binding-like beta-propeller repeat protein [Streptomyces sp. NPDC086766]|uniref:outer membrane protein assembly factor BamB family protein n=1 Tax=Streptomyces sp. NPDC086766 TaxID=3365754 RepID=UPI00382CEB5E
MVEDSRPRGGGGLAWPVAAALAVLAAGAAVGLAVEFHYLGWTSFPGNGCGGRYAPCPDGTTPTLLLAFLLTFTGFPAATAAVAALTKARPGKVLPAALLTAGVLLALWPGRQAYLWMRGPVLDVVWKAGPDRPPTARGLGVWTVGPGSATVVRVRTDALVAYDARDGDRAWTLRVPVRESVCGMSESVTDGIGLVAFGRFAKPCDTVWGVDVRTGRKVWERGIDGVTDSSEARDSLLTADAGVAVALADGSVRGFGLADGAPRWTAKVTDARARKDDVECTPLVASAARGTTRVVVTCSSLSGVLRTARLLTLDTATGRETGRRPLPVESAVRTAVVVSAEPFTLLLQEEDKRGLAAVLSWSGTGGEPVDIPLTTDDEDLAVLPDDGSFAARPALSAVVEGRSLIVAAAVPGKDDPERISAYSLADGRPLWHTDLGAPIAALAPADRGELAVLGSDARLYTLDERDGDRRGEADGTTVRGADGDYGELAGGSQLLRAGGTWIVVNSTGSSSPPVLGLRP